MPKRAIRPQRPRATRKSTSLHRPTIERVGRAALLVDQTVSVDRRFGVRVVDRSVDKSLPLGVCAICAPLKEGEEVAVGDMLYIERERDGLKECSLRRVSRINGKKMQLSTHSKLTRLHQDLAYPPNPKAERIRLVGRVVAVYTDL